MNVDLGQLVNMATTLIKSAPAILGWIIIARLAFDRVKAFNQPVSPIDAAYTMAALAAFSYAIR